MPTLREIQYARLLNRGFRALAMKGIRPNFQKVVETLRALLNRDKQGATLDPVPMKDGHAFPLEGFNKNLGQTRFDLEGLYEGSLFLASGELENSLVIQETTHELRRQLAKAAESIERELLVIGSNFLDSTVIRFADSDNIDLDETTAELNFEDGLVTLATRGGVRRVAPARLPSGPIDLETLNDDAQVLPGSDFASMFTDSFTGWQVKTAGDFLRVRVDLGKRLQFGRVQIQIPDEGATVELRISHDSVNFIKPVDPQVVQHGRVNFVFESSEAQYIELYITKPVPQNEAGNVFTLQTVAMYSAGFEAENYLTTNTLELDGSGLIKAATIDVDAEIPDGASVDVEVAAIDSQGAQYPWRQVKSRVVDFTQSARGRSSFRATPLTLYSSSPALGTPTARGLTPHGRYNSALGMNDVWAIDDSIVLPAGAPAKNVDERSLKLYRVDNWACNSQVMNESVAVVNKMLMQPASTQSLYIQIVDEIHDQASSGTTISLDREIISNADVALKGNEHAKVVRVSGTVDQSVQTAASFSATITVTGSGTDKVATLAATLPAFADYFDRIYIPGVGEVDILESDQAGGSLKLDPRPDYSPVLGGAVTVRYQSRDLTSLLTSAAGKTLTFSQNILAGERVIVTYNSPMIRTQEDAVKSSIEVYSSIDSTRKGKLGVDYRVRENQVELLNTTSLPNQPTQNKYPIEVRFSYNKAVAGATMYTAWCHVPEGANRVVEIAQPVRLFTAEKVTWMNTRGQVLDMEGLETLTLEPGWHRFTVVGQKAITEHGDIDQASALWQLLNIESAGGSYVFRSQNGYFDMVTGFRDPMVPVGTFFLQRQAYPNDREHFSYDEGEIKSVMRLDNPPDAIKLEPGNTSVLSAADYRLEYSYFQSAGISQIKVRLKLKRDPQSDPSITPVVRGLRIRYT